MQPAVRAVRLTKTFTKKSGVTEAVKGVDLLIESGERIACIGPNGAGKSTTIKMLTGILQPTTGSAEVFGITPWKHRSKLAMTIGVLFGQRSQLWADLTVRQGLRLLGAIYRLGNDRDRRVEEVATLLDARDLLDEPVRSLSLGQRMRCELAASLLHSPRLLFLDEPTIGLDLVAKQKFREMLVRLNEERGTTVFLTSHDIPDVEAVAERTIIINHGVVLHDAPTADLARSLLSTKLVEVRVHAGSVDAIDGMTVNEVGYRLFELSIDLARLSVRDALDHVLSNADVADIEVSDPALEDVISQIYEKSS